MPPEKSGHAAHVTTWMNGSAEGLPSDEVVMLFERAIGSLWKRAERTLGEVTLMAICDRVLFIATEKYPVLATLKIDETGIRFDEFRPQAAAGRDDQLREGIRFVLVEFLTVLGNLTDEILTPALHAELSKVVIEQPKRASKQVQEVREIRRSKDAGPEGANS